MEHACTFNLNNKNYIIGGDDHQKQVLIGLNHNSNIFYFLDFGFKTDIQRISDMPIESYLPTCASFDFNNQSFALICFASGYQETCYK